MAEEMTSAEVRSKLVEALRLDLVGPGIDRGVVFQDYSLFPWMSLTENVVLAIGKAHPSLTREQRQELAEEYLELVGLAEARAKYPGELSGGMCQRGAIARQKLEWQETALHRDPRQLPQAVEEQPGAHAVGAHGGEFRVELARGKLPVEQADHAPQEDRRGRQRQRPRSRRAAHAAAPALKRVLISFISIFN